ncbi:galactosyltransferase-related protein [Siphonobacter sp. SORGH_AS_1065]|uniref:galactosyltransferase-related protein n=1 Tax=Siphonobacter sp. SORGH_AS_1065 TaxID=3041795 RepID=UPI00277E9D8C|nr:galactosyltransferase-related protein [Siphonobacter sp. SORGH_AS_1065]MDQ1090495.1 putative glycosyltransferase involved in capsule biosynthesis [Siphonobacter sp. SORGH_AS_1065]
MIFLSAQPDSLYMKWQIQVFLFNINKLGISSQNIHVLIGYDPTEGINPIYQDNFDPIFARASIFFYPDNRIQRNYIPGIRPHIIKKHFDKFPELESESIFYHDADIVFRELPNFDELLRDDKWYVSNTLKYTSPESILKAGKIVLDEMLECLNIPLDLILKNNSSSGGAQYLFKKLNYEFWNEVELYSEILYNHLQYNKKRYIHIFVKENMLSEQYYNNVLEWCADMWAILWLALKNDIDILISDELDFCWPNDDLTRWNDVKILHNAGLDTLDSWQYFYKGDFVYSTPFTVSLDYVRNDKCSIKYVQIIKEYLDDLKYKVKDVTFLIPIRIDSNDRLNNLYTIISFINKYFNTNIIIIEADTFQHIDILKLPQCTEYIFIEDNSEDFHRTKYNNMMIDIATTDIIILQDADVIISPEQLFQAIELIREGKNKIVIPYDGCFKMVHDKYQLDFFRKKLDIQLLYTKQTYTVREKSCGGAVVLDRQTYIDCGKENEAFIKWGPEDIERVRRMEILGHKAAWINSGHLYHLYHEVNNNSEYSSLIEYCKLMRVQLDVIALSPNELQNEIEKWKK